MGYFNFQDKNIDALAEANILSNTVTGRHKENIDKFITWCGANGVAVYGAVGDYSAAFGGKCSAVGKRSLAEGTTVIAVGDYSHVEGNNCVTLGHNAHAEGR